MPRMMADCRRFPSESNCSLVIIGEEDEVIRAGAEHAASVHGHEDTPALREQMRSFLEPAEAYAPGPRAQEQMPASRRFDLKGALRRASASAPSGRWLNASIRPVLKHGPRSLTCMRAGGWQTHEAQVT